MRTTRMQAVISVALIMVLCTGVLEAKEKPIEELPKDVWRLAFLWTEPLQQAARETRRLDPISGL